jgi:hypothetical protein
MFMRVARHYWVILLRLQGKYGDRAFSIQTILLDSSELIGGGTHQYCCLVYNNILRQ